MNEVGVNMFVTTSGRTNGEKINEAKEIAQSFNVQYIARRKESILELQRQQDSDCLVVGKNRLELYARREQQPFFFHPSSGMFRLKRLESGGYDPFIEAAGLKKGKSLLDCTLGLASDSIVASYAVGAQGLVTGIEGNKVIAYIVSEGLQTWDCGNESMNQALRRVNVMNALSLSYLQQLPDRSYDCVYFDPMFETTITESEGIHALRSYAVQEGLTESMMWEAMRVAKERVVLKDHFRSSRFEKFPFEVIKRKSAKFHYGIIKKE